MVTDFFWDFDSVICVRLPFFRYSLVIIADEAG